jgi:hypothetical protein
MSYLQWKASPRRAFNVPPMRLWLILSSLDAITASIAEVQRSLVSLTNVVATIASRQPLEGDAASIKHQSRHRHESTSVATSSATSVAPIQVVRDMNYWITGRRPNGRTETTVQDGTPVVSLEVSSERNYIRA